MIRLMANSQGPDVDLEATLEDVPGAGVFLGLKFSDQEAGGEQADWCTDEPDQIRAFFREMRALEEKYRRLEMKTRPAHGQADT